MVAVDLVVTHPSYNIGCVREDRKLNHDEFLDDDVQAMVSFF